MNIFVDTSAFYALMSRVDAKHTEAVTRWDRVLADSSITMYTSNYVVVETVALVQNRLGVDAVSIFTRDILPAVTIIWVDEPTHFAATEAVLTAGRKNLSLVDCSSFAIMHESGITTAFTYDDHFPQQGFSLS